MTDDTTRKVRVPARAWVYIEGTQAWADRHKLGRDDFDGTEDASTAKLWLKVADTKPLSDGSRMVPMTRDERLIFLDYATSWILGPQDNAGPDDMDALHDLRSLYSLIRHLTEPN